MELKPTSGYSFSGHIPIEICQDDWRSLLSNIEAETDTSKVYSLMLTDIKTSLEEAVSHTETQIKVLGLEAIKLSLKNLTITLIPEKKASSADPIYSHSQNMNEQKKSINYQQMNQEQLIQNHQNKPQTHMSTNLTTTVESEITTESALVSIDSNNMETHLPENNQNSSEELPLENNRRKRRKKLTKAEKAALLVEEKNTYLQQLGEKLQKARKMRCLSMKQIHKQTFVPLHYLEAIEKGQTDELPEDIYLRGFIFRIGNALGFDGVALAEALPMSDPLQSLIPSWSNSNKDIGLGIGPIHLYIGYTALMAGAVGGLSWMSQQPSPGANLTPDKLDTPDSVAHSDKHLETTQTPGLKSTKGSVVVGSDVAPPETMI
ncbi:MAG: hypothetical protein F6K25_06905 [Okeania sp. SIO2G4]|uniref:helix-turn-helix domain-containing protein n=1 Tax=unclassified Okeania TaxID=2634635 RepID=UPI0013B84DAA|nr:MULTISPECIES: helix-turn-helix domain-containing protein [unclassified Okeania]NEP41102.1 hypothetical protein [Okeania sp. SIO2H7]NEP71761.1 hypothetical protein [Okeania sp. SIO2G5]NEP92467.1 hypothetical protein [Okeania sp. SIO2F5]NEQ90461.1 hypothetical protein [Okeania sp. SIO2G4]